MARKSRTPRTAFGPNQLREGAKSTGGIRWNPDSDLGTSPRRPSLVLRLTVLSPSDVALGRRQRSSGINLKECRCALPCREVLWKNSVRMIAVR